MLHLYLQLSPQSGNVISVADLEGFLWFLQKPLLKLEETFQDKFNGHALNLYKPINLYTHTNRSNFIPKPFYQVCKTVKVRCAINLLLSHVHIISYRNK